MINLAQPSSKKEYSKLKQDVEEYKYKEFEELSKSIAPKID